MNYRFLNGLILTSSEDVSRIRSDLAGNCAAESRLCVLRLGVTALIFSIASTLTQGALAEEGIAAVCSITANNPDAFLDGGATEVQCKAIRADATVSSIESDIGVRASRSIPQDAILLGKLRDEIRELKDEVVKLKDENFELRARVSRSARSSRTEDLTDQLFVVRAKLVQIEELTDAVDSTTSSLRESIVHLEKDLSNEIVLQSAQLEAVISNTRIELGADLSEVRISVTQLELEVIRLDYEVVLIKQDLRLLMGEFRKGNLGRAISFFGVGLSAVDARDDIPIRYDVQYERLITRGCIEQCNVIGLVLEVSYLDWSEDDSFETLPGRPKQSFTVDHETGFLNLGAKLYRGPWYGGVFGGHGIFGEETSSWSASAVAGAEFYRSNSRIAIEMRTDWYTSFASEERDFNEAGDTTITTDSESVATLGLGLRLSFR